jgi:hypothetical protein
LLGSLLAGLAAGLPFASSAQKTLAERPLASAFDLGTLVAAFKVTSPHTIPFGFSLGNFLAFARGYGVTLAEGFERLLPAGMAREHSRGR